MLPWSQCAAHCDNCNAAGAGKCDIDGCFRPYVRTKDGTCAPVRLRKGTAACTIPRCARAAPSLTKPCVRSLDHSALLAAAFATQQGRASAMNVKEATF